MAAITAVVLTWNNFDDTDECLRSLVAQDTPCDVVVVDNGSVDGSREHLEAIWAKRVEFICNPINLGVASGYNAGIRRALEQGAEYVCLLNNDISLAPNFLTRCMEPFSSRQSVAITSPIIVYHGERDRVWFCDGIYHRALGIPRHAYLAKSLSKIGHLIGQTYPVNYIPLCAAMLSREALTDAGLLDELFFVGHEDVDWCLRVQQRGYSCVVVGEPLVRHKVSISAGVPGSNVLGVTQAYHYAYGSILLARKHAAWPALAVVLAGQLLVRFPYYGLGMVRSGRPRGVINYLKGLIHGSRDFLIKRRGAT